MQSLVDILKCTRTSKYGQKCSETATVIQNKAGSGNCGEVMVLTQPDRELEENNTPGGISRALSVLARTKPHHYRAVCTTLLSFQTIPPGTNQISATLVDYFGVRGFALDGLATELVLALAEIPCGSLTLTALTVIFAICIHSSMVLYPVAHRGTG